MSAFGILPFGTQAPWGGPGLISLHTILAIGCNELVAFFDGAPRVRDPLGYRDARNAEAWVIAPIDPAIVAIDGQVVVPHGRRRPTVRPWIGEVFADPDDPTQVHLRTVPQLEPGIEYDVTLAGSIRGALCEEFGGVATFRVRSRTRPEPERSRFGAQDTYRDWANPFGDDGSGGLATGHWTLDETGDRVLDNATTSLKKRVTRRLITALGGFAHLPRYGLTGLMKKLARPGDLQGYAVRIQAQLRSEPDVRDASVTASLVLDKAGSGLVRFQVRVQARAIGEVSFVVQVPAGGV